MIDIYIHGIERESKGDFFISKLQFNACLSKGGFYVEKVYSISFKKDNQKEIVPLEDLSHDDYVQWIRDSGNGSNILTIENELNEIADKKIADNNSNEFLG